MTRLLGSGVLAGALALGLTSTISTATANEVTPTPTPTQTATTPAPSDSAPDPQAQAADGPVAAAAAPWDTPGYPIIQETNFAEPRRSVNSEAYSDFSQLDELERLICGTFKVPDGSSTPLCSQRSLRPEAQRRATYIQMSVSRMERSKRVGRKLIEAAKWGVNVRFVHGADSQSAASRSLASQLNSATFKGIHTGWFKICAKGKSLACISTAKGGIIHTKSLIIGSSNPAGQTVSYTREGKPAASVVWYGSANLGGPSGEYTWNNGQTIYNDKLLYIQSAAMFQDLLGERTVSGNNYPGYIRAASLANTRFGYPGAKVNDGYKSDYADYGMFYSNLSNYTVHASPIAATPLNGKDPIMAALNRVIPDDKCKIKVLENRWKYRRLAIAEKLVELSNGGCDVSVVAFQDDLAENRALHCQIYIRVCRPILDELRTANVHIIAAWAKPHDKVILIEALLKKNPQNPLEVQANGAPWPTSGGARATMVQAGSAALTGSNLLASDEVTTESLDPDVYADYVQHWRNIGRSYEYKIYPY
ncbi:hypothetical protein GCM10022234_34290 [Aeromicrobium panaciterrae]|uniref:phospholipase D-like domain-containing protein n=1 Tax=Aeromicrobium panaciterrae TaxID=363861 RepID=UPI0031D1F0DE